MQTVKTGTGKLTRQSNRLTIITPPTTSATATTAPLLHPLLSADGTTLLHPWGIYECRTVNVRRYQSVYSALLLHANDGTSGQGSTRRLGDAFKSARTVCGDRKGGGLFCGTAATGRTSGTVTCGWVSRY